MPYKLSKKGEKYCVVNSDTGENKGCSDTRKMAVGHMRKLYMVENEGKGKDALVSSGEVDGLIIKAAAEFMLETGESFEDGELDADKSMYAEDSAYATPMMSSPLFGATSYAEIEQQQEAYKAQAKIETLIWDFPSLARNIMSNPDIEDKGAAIEDLATELANLITEIKSGDGDDDKGLDELESNEKTTEETGVEASVEAGEETDEQKAQRRDVSEADKKRAVSEYGNVTYADPENKKYPIDTKAHIRAAWSYINMPRNAKKYDSSKLASIKSRIRSAAKKQGIEISGKSIDKNLLQRGVDLLQKALSIFDTPEPESDLMMWKEADGRWMWLARYSNNFIDQDSPPEIISERSHRRFVEMVDKGVYPYPELWLWHNKEWNIGKAVWCAYDDSGFAIATGYSNPGCEPVFESLSKLKDVGLSHGMPIASLQRDPNDDRVITEHQTKEISVLPLYAAANRLTSFYILKEMGEEDEMPIPKEKKAEALEKWGLSETLLNQIETLNKATADQAVKDGMENKEKEEGSNTPPTSEATAETAAAETTVVVQATTEETHEHEEGEEEISEEVLNAPPSRKELADSLAPYLQKMNQIFESVEALKTELTTLKEQRVEDQAKAEKEKADESLIRMSPTAALLNMFGASAVGNKEAALDESDPLNKEHPKQAPVKQITGIPFVDAMITQSNNGG